MFSQAFARGTPPCQQRADARQQEQEQANGHHHHVEVGRPDRDFVAGDGFGDHREHHAPEDGKGGGDKEQIVEQKPTLARDGRFVLRLAFEQVQARDQEEGREDDDEDDQHAEPGANRRLGKRVYRRHHPAAREERAVDAQGKGGDDQDHVPDLEHALFFLDHHRVQKSRAGQPGQQGGIFDRIPTPVPAPAEHDVGPFAAQELACAQEKPREQGPAARGANPFFVDLPGQERGHGKGVGHDEAHIAVVEHGGVYRHDRVDEQGVHTRSVG